MSASKIEFLYQSLSDTQAIIRATCRIPDDQIAYKSYPLLAARELLQQFIQEQVHGHQAA
ncbi:MAG TPA: hypothetical protein DHW46_00530 [Halomonas sp.]|uniref:Uncharacterized protein n=1 Tax=Vreelandella aquamarina TaxID=77097 RepID=A0A6F8STT8_9GAMM|nr:hypothetical protein AUR68_24715 [Idiomarina sp. H105]OAE89729.1 hypothetical protein AWR38_24755 [Idiomarina sp. WRN-38]BCA91579.1 hypothetical protein HMSLTHF_13540 [Halomonas meridiana]HBN62183.1 hypothetical protein [Halomonas sp.]HCL22177.1 hypothetical protein [Halomonas sp.]